MPTYGRFVYSPSTSDTIRLLRVLNDEGPLRYRLSTFSKDDTPDFHALSYSWDGQSRDQVIVCNESMLAVTLNVQKLLPYFHLEYESHHIWIDAICIDQDSPIDQNVQIPLMRMIYTKAIKVIVWLGESDSQVDRTLEVIPELIPRLRNFDGRLGIDDVRLASHGLPKRSDEIWHGTRNLFSRSWFTRLWVLQEVVLSESVVVMCGNKIMNMDYLVDFGGSMASASVVDLTRDTDAAFMAVLTGFSLLLKISLFKRCRANGQGIKFMSLLEASRDFSVTRDVDRVYGLLGLASDVLGKIISVDVTKSAVEVYIEAAKFDIATDPTLGLLRLASSNQPLEGLPSWCPNFSRPRGTSMFGCEVFKHDSAENASISLFPFVSSNQPLESLRSLWPNFTASRPTFLYDSLTSEGGPIHYAGLNPSLLKSAPGILDPLTNLFHATTSTTNNLLGVSGVELDQIAQVVPGGWQWDNSANIRLSDGRAARTLVWEDACLKVSQRVYGSPSDRDVPEAHWRALIANTLNGKIAPATSATCTSS
ncbi:MAG: hypothetical protein ASARMPREDX12_003762 [Alectoria sarmentosa]|nr:MAG: hypothetical protein ASARMPREDX12_003762 [Alectoria sarmentosa]